jgi:carboxymethylenebutenolidase
MHRSREEIRTADGVCPSYLFHPTSGGPWPAVLMYMDGVGIRPAMLEVGERLATYGYLVLLPDLFYRAGPYEPMNAAQVFGDPQLRQMLRDRFSVHVTQGKIMSDTEAFLAYLAARPDVKPGPAGATGYCVGGRMALAAAGTYPDRIAALAAYHPGGLASDAPDSPHLLAPRIKARVYVAAASDDPSFPEDMKARLEAALTSAGVDHLMETYPAKHGWVLRDTPVHDVAATERHYQTMVALFQAKLT